MTSVAGGAAGLSALSSIFSSIVSWAMTICQFIGFWFTFKKMQARMEGNNPLLQLLCAF